MFNVPFSRPSSLKTHYYNLNKSNLSSLGHVIQQWRNRFDANGWNTRYCRDPTTARWYSFRMQVFSVEVAQLGRYMQAPFLTIPKLWMNESLTIEENVKCYYYYLFMEQTYLQCLKHIFWQPFSRIPPTEFSPIMILVGIQSVPLAEHWKTPIWDVTWICTV